MTGHRPTISYVIVAYNSATALRKSLPALSRELSPGDEIVVVDNASSDDSKAIVGELCPAATIIDAGGNTGFATGANTGAAVSRGDLIVFLNPDVTVASGFGAAIRTPLIDDRGWDAWMGLVTESEGTIINSSGNVIHFTGIGWAGGAGAALRPAEITAHEVAYLSGACLAVPRSVWRSHDGFPGGYFMYHEDLDFSLRVRLAGGRIGIEPAARADHDYSFHKGPAKWRFMERNRLSMIVRLYPGPLIVLLLPALVATELTLLAAAFAAGWGRQKLLANAQWLRQMPVLLSQRRVIQRDRAISTSEFAQWLSSDLSSPLLGSVANAAPLRWLLRTYWMGVRVVLEILGSDQK